MWGRERGGERREKGERNRVREKAGKGREKLLMERSK